MFHLILILTEYSVVNSLGANEKKNWGIIFSVLKSKLFEPIIKTILGT